MIMIGEPPLSRPCGIAMGVDGSGSEVARQAARQEQLRVEQRPRGVWDLLGASQGGTIAATLGARRDDLDAIVLPATPAAPIHEVLATQVDTLATLVDATRQGTQPAAAQAVAGLQELADTVAAVADGRVDGPPVDGVPRAFWASWIGASRAAPERLTTASAPVLVLGGSSDWNVPPDHVEAWAPVLRAEDHLEILP